MLAAGARSTFSFIPCRAANLLSTRYATNHCQFPIANCQLHSRPDLAPKIGNRKLAIGNTLVPHGDLAL